MASVSQLLASGTGWRVHDVVCTAGPHNRPFEEQHEPPCIAAVTSGTFRYRSTQGSATLVPGAVLLGNERHCYECSHEHSAGDRCLSFHFEPEFFEQIMTAVPGARRISFDVPNLPPLPALIPVVAAAQAARDNRHLAELEELALCLAGTVSVALAGAKRPTRLPSPRDELRVAAALRRIEQESHQPLLLADLARDAATSPYHFLRLFLQVVGVTPHQYLMRTRLHEAAVRLRRSSESVLTIVLETGFNDVSTFNDHFRRIMGMSPSAYRRLKGVGHICVELVVFRLGREPDFILDLEPRLKNVEVLIIFTRVLSSRNSTRRDENDLLEVVVFRAPNTLRIIRIARGSNRNARRDLAAQNPRFESAASPIATCFFL